MTNIIDNFGVYSLFARNFLKGEIKILICMYIFTQIYVSLQIFKIITIGSHEWWHELAITYTILKNSQNNQGTLKEFGYKSKFWFDF